MPKLSFLLLLKGRLFICHVSAVRLIASGFSVITYTFNLIMSATSQDSNVRIIVYMDAIAFLVFKDNVQPLYAMLNF